MSGAGWSCTLATLTCLQNDVLAPGATYAAITLTVNVAGTAPSSVTSRATVSGGGESNAVNDTALDVTAVTQVPDLTLTKTHIGTFTQGQAGATYTLVVANTSAADTSGARSLSHPVSARLPGNSPSGAGRNLRLAETTGNATEALAAM